MTANKGQANNEVYKKIKTILVSQPKPERSPYYELERKYDLTIHWRKFIQVEPVNAREFRKFKIYPTDYSAIIFTSKNSIDHFFRLMEEMRITISQDLRYFCLTEAIANYLQKFIVYRKRKVFVGIRKIEDLATPLNKFKATERFLLPCSNLGAKDVCAYLDKNGWALNEQRIVAPMMKSLPANSHIKESEAKNKKEIIARYDPSKTEFSYEKKGFKAFKPTKKSTKTDLRPKENSNARTDKDSFLPPQKKRLVSPEIGKKQLQKKPAFLTKESLKVSKEKKNNSSSPKLSHTVPENKRPVTQVVGKKTAEKKVEKKTATKTTAKKAPAKKPAAKKAPVKK